MSIDYLEGLPWSSWTRDERFFCSVLYSRAYEDPAKLAAHLIELACLNARDEGSWDLGFEVCFYRDFLWHRGQSAVSDHGLPAKRTFDLCLFGERDVIVVEAKVCEAFDKLQNEDFAKDVSRINSLPDLAHLNVHIVALASSRYFENAAKYGDPSTLGMFSGRVTWAQLAAHYEDDPLMVQADRMYGAKPRQALGWTV